MENQLVKQNLAPVVAKESLIKWLDLAGVGKNISQSEKEMFLEIAMLNGLNPFKREIYITAYGEGQYRTVSILTGYEVYIRRAEESGLLDGWKVDISGSVANGNLKAKLTIYRKNFAHPFEWEVGYLECVQKTKGGEPNKFWKEKPEHMTKKVAISQGFRLCFNQVLGGMPYTNDEIQDVQHEIIETKQPEKPKKTTLSEKGFAKIIEKFKNEPVDTLVKLIETCELSPKQIMDFDTVVFEYCKNLDPTIAEKLALQHEILSVWHLPKEMSDFLIQAIPAND